MRALWMAVSAAIAVASVAAISADGDGTPAAVTDFAATALDTPVEVPVLANDSDPDGDLLSLIAVGAPAHGTATFAGDIVTYTPGPGFEGVDHFLYTISDGNDHTATGLVSVYVAFPPPPPAVLTVTPAFLDYGVVPLNKTRDRVVTVRNDTEQPVALAETFVVEQGDPRPFDASDFDGCRQPPARVLDPGESCTQKIRFWSVPDAGAASPATVRLLDGGTFETIATFPLFASVGPADTGPNRPPQAQDDLVGVAPGFDHVLDAIRNDSDPDDDLLRITAVSDPPHGTTAVVRCTHVNPNADCVRYVPDDGYLGIDAFAYTVSDGRGGTATATFHLAVGNVVPQIAAVTPAIGPTAGGQAIRITGSGFVFRSEADFSCPSAVLPLAITSLTDTEILAITPPAPADVCTLRVRTLFGRQGLLANAYRYADAPVAQDVSATTDEDTAVTITLAATHPQGHPLAFSIVSGPSHGALSTVTGNQVTYSPAADYHGPDAFTFKASDGVLDSNTATASITVRPVDDVLLAVDDTYTVQQDSTLMSGPARLEVFQTQLDPPAVRDVIDLDGTVFLLGRHPTRGTGLWRTDGTAQGTALIKAMPLGHLGRAGKTLFFTTGKQLWKSDGTPQGTTLVKDLASSIDTAPFDLRDVGGTLFFLVNMLSPSQDWDGQELWESDGTAEGTVLLKALNPGFQAAVAPLYPTSVNGTLFLRPQNGTAPGGIGPDWFDLWKSDGTPESTVLLKDVNPGNLDFLAPYPNTLVNVDGTLFFAGDEKPRTGPFAMDLWKSDGTPEGTVKVKVLGAPQVTFPTDFTNVNGTLFFIVHNQQNVDYRNELWKSDGTAQGTTLLKTTPGTVFWMEPAFMTHVNGTVFYKSRDSLWKSDGTPQGTLEMVHQGVDALASANGTVFFFKEGDELWKTDGTPAGTVFVRDLLPGMGFIENLTASGGSLLFTATTDVLPARTQALWATGTAANLLANDVVPASATPAVALMIPPAHGNLTVNADGTFHYRPDTGYTGADSFTYRVETQDQTSNEATVTITVTAPPPTVSVAGASALEGNASPNATVPVVLTLSAPSAQPVTVGYKTIDDTARAAQGDYVAATGTVTFAPGQTSRTIDLQVVPDTTLEPDETFTVRLTTAAGATVADGHASVTIINDDTSVPPVAGDDGPFSVLEGDVLTVAPPGVLANDADPEQAALTARFVTAPSHGVLFLRPSGGFDYTPGAGYAGPDSFTYVANDGHADSNVATVSLVVLPRVVAVDVAETIHVTDDAAVEPAVMIEVAETVRVSDGESLRTSPQAHDGTAATAEDTPVQIALSATDASGEPFTLTIVGAAAHGTVFPPPGVVVPAGTLVTYTPAPDYFGGDAFMFKATNALGDSNVATVTIAVAPVNDRPFATADSYIVNSGETRVVPTPGLLGNDVDVELDPLTARLVTGPAHGTLTLAADGSFTYRPHANFMGTDTFTYVASDGTLDSSPATVSVVVFALGHEIVSGTVPPGGTVTTDTEGDGATAADVIETFVLTPQGGLITIEERPEPPPLPTAFTLLEPRVHLTAPPATASQPLLLTFLLDGSVLPAGVTATALAVFRDGVEVAPCAAGAPGATPDPCVAARQNVDGDARLAVRTSRASVWSFGVRRSTSGLATGALRPRSGGNVTFAGTRLHGQPAGALSYQKGSEQFLALRLSAFAVENDGRRAWLAGVGADGRTFLAYAEDRGASGDVFRLWIAGVEKTGDGSLSSGQVVVVR